MLFNFSLKLLIGLLYQLVISAQAEEKGGGEGGGGEDAQIKPYMEGFKNMFENGLLVIVKTIWRLGFKGRTC